MNLAELNLRVDPRPTRKRRGRGGASGLGGTGGRGHKGAGQRTGAHLRDFFEGGQMPISRRIPKRGFSRAEIRVPFRAVNVRDLNGFEDGATVDPAALVGAGLARDGEMVKILGAGKLERKLAVKAQRFSASAKKAIEEKGGTAEAIVVPSDVAVAKWRGKRNKGQRTTRQREAVARATARSAKGS